MRSEKITIINNLGLHARAAAKLVGVATRFQCEITVANNGKLANAKSIMAVMMLAASKGCELEVTLDGSDEDAAWNDVAGLINNYFDEGQ